MSGHAYADRIARYLHDHFGERGLAIYREVHLGKTIIGKKRKVDVFLHHGETGRALALECKTQASQGTADEKLFYTLQDLEAMQCPAYLVYSGEGFSRGVLHMLEASPLAAQCDPPDVTVELDHILAATFGWWDLVLDEGRRFPKQTRKPRQAR